jgi:hypothetical protein
MSDFQYEADYKVLICKAHQQAVKGLDTHLRDAHGLSTIKERQPILDQYSSFFLLPPKAVPLPPNNCAPFEALGKPLDGFLCSCGHISINYKSIRGHCNTKHNWRVSKSDPTYWTKVKVQTFFGVGFQRYFIVRDEEGHGDDFTLVESGEEDEDTLL